MERGCDLYSTELPKDRDGKTYFWLDYVTLRQCQCCPSPHAPPGWPNPRDFDLKSVNALIKEVGFTMAELGARPLRYLTSAFCLYESFSALPTPTKPTSARGFSHDDEKTRKKRDRKQQAALVAKRKAAAEKAAKEKKEKELADKNAKAKQRESSRKKAADSSNSPSPTKAATPSDKSGGSKKQATHLLSGDELKASVKARKRGKDGKDADDDHGEEEEVLTFRNEKVFAIVDFVRAAAISTLNISGPRSSNLASRQRTRQLSSCLFIVWPHARYALRISLKSIRVTTRSWTVPREQIHQRGGEGGGGCSYREAERSDGDEPRKMRACR